ncbi:MAG: hypothetical protein V1900_02710 [Candidatus Aenigmatarchaeota archaeon]
MKNKPKRKISVRNNSSYIIIIAIMIVVIAVVSIFSYKQPAPVDTTLPELKAIAEQSPLVNDYAGVQPTYRKLSAQDVQSSIAAGLFSADASNEIYFLNYIKDNQGISLIIDKASGTILKTQVVVGIGQ